MKYLLIASLLAFSGCFLTVQIQSDPWSAEIYVNGKDMGKAPVELKFNLTEEIKEKGIIITDTICAIWKSGAETKLIDTIQIKNGISQKLILNRPKGFPDEYKDMNFILEPKPNEYNKNKKSSHEN